MPDGVPCSIECNYATSTSLSPSEVAKVYAYHQDLLHYRTCLVRISSGKSAQDVPRSFGDLVPFLFEYAMRESRQGDDWQSRSYTGVLACAREEHAQAVIQHIYNVRAVSFPRHRLLDLRFDTSRCWRHQLPVPGHMSLSVIRYDDSWHTFVKRRMSFRPFSCWTGMPSPWTQAQVSAKTIPAERVATPAYTEASEPFAMRPASKTSRSSASASWRRQMLLNVPLEDRYRQSFLAVSVSSLPHDVPANVPRDHQHSHSEARAHHTTNWRYLPIWPALASDALDA